MHLFEGLQRFRLEALEDRVVRGHDLQTLSNLLGSPERAEAERSPGVQQGLVGVGADPRVAHEHEQGPAPAQIVVEGGEAGCPEIAHVHADHQGLARQVVHLEAIGGLDPRREATGPIPLWVERREEEQERIAFALLAGHPAEHQHRHLVVHRQDEEEFVVQGVAIRPQPYRTPEVARGG